MTTNEAPAAAGDRETAGTDHGTAVEDMDLSPLGLADAPAKEEDQDSIVHPGNS
jgi:hypothetical protein